MDLLQRYLVKIPELFHLHLKVLNHFFLSSLVRVPIVELLVITIVSLLSGEPASQAIFKGLGAAVGGALGTSYQYLFLEH